MTQDMSPPRVSKGAVDGRLGGKVALITGAGGGQGRQAALLFAKAGAQIVSCDISAEGLAETARVAKVQGFTIDTATVDATDEKQVQEWVDEAAGRHGGIDILYNNGAKAHFGAFPDVSIEQWRDTLRFELDVVFVPSRAVWRHMIAAGGGCIVNIASVLGMRGFPAAGNIGGTPHAAGKAGVIGLTNQLAAEGARHWIRVNAISPGPIRTPVVEAMMEENPGFKKLADGCTMLSRPGYAQDVVYAGLFLCSDEASFITGVNLPVDGGSASMVGLSFDYPG